MSIIGSGGVASASSVSTGTVENVTIAVANTEQSHTFPANTKKFTVKARDAGKILLAFALGQSGVEYHTISAGAFYGAEGVVAPAMTIYFQSPVAGLVVELTSWS
jgi:uncharacterized membrane protein